ncbi:MAG: hypothetical protein ACYCW6_05645 [Candidatus Xenobia bacterium]
MSPTDPDEKTIAELENEVKLLRKVLEKALPSYLEQARKTAKPKASIPPAEEEPPRQD